MLLPCRQPLLLQIRRGRHQCLRCQYPFLSWGAWGDPKSHPSAWSLTQHPPDLLPLVLVTLVLGYVDSHNLLTSSPVKFTLALLSIMPLSYYIGMAIAR